VWDILIHILVVTTRLKPEHRDAWIDRMTRHIQTCRANEPDCLQLDLVQSNDDPDHVFLYEVYESKESFDAHWDSSYQKQLMVDVQGWAVEPPEIILCTNVYPVDSEMKSWAS